MPRTSKGTSYMAKDKKKKPAKMAKKKKKKSKSMY
tara:strand:+ start:540 stop:644 length:105 start_codon:yes stop_codon:yes gene_type:complete